jgi:hypothetical protein
MNYTRMSQDRSTKKIFMCGSYVPEIFDDIILCNWMSSIPVLDPEDPLFGEWDDSTDWTWGQIRARMSLLGYVWIWEDGHWSYDTEDGNYYFEGDELTIWTPPSGINSDKTIAEYVLFKVPANKTLHLNCFDPNHYAGGDYDSYPSISVYEISPEYDEDTVTFNTIPALGDLIVTKVGSLDFECDTGSTGALLMKISSGSDEWFWCPSLEINWTGWDEINGDHSSYYIPYYD